jgi:hypothetical protein
MKLLKHLPRLLLAFLCGALLMPIVIDRLIRMAESNYIRCDGGEILGYSPTVRNNE